jgi:outer membrane protein assembly factor BamB
MDCSKVRDQLDLLAMGDLPQAARAMVTAHLDTCSECRKALDECHEILAAIRSAAPPVRPCPAFVRAVQSAVRGEVRRARRGRWARRAASAGAAAAAVLLMGFGVWHVATRVPRGAPAEPARHVADVEQWRLEGATAVPTSSSDGVVVQGPRMFFVHQAETGNRVAAASVATGHLLWEAQVDWYSHLAADPSRVYCHARGSGRTTDLVSLDAITGDLLWRYSPGAPPGLQGPCPPVPLAAGRVCWTVGHAVHMLDGETGRRIWERSFANEGWLSAAAGFGSDVYVASAAALHCLSAESGEQVWRLDLEAGETTLSL